MPIVCNTVQGGSRDVVRLWVVINFSDIGEGIIVEKRIGDHVKKLYARLTEYAGRIIRVLLPKPEENLESE